MREAFRNVARYVGHTKLFSRLFRKKDGHQQPSTVINDTSNSPFLESLRGRDPKASADRQKKKTDNQKSTDGGSSDPLHGPGSPYRRFRRSDRNREGSDYGNGGDDGDDGGDGGD
ncbi:uncharacterized protein LOC129583693 isoform X5 [Paramacrobiotus metropolitanus]|uniref:uncharacterized protein LOC129583693 isoform X5 n=1 Tax=Paramacrobiotus metropolitanus TaxID=2943436 RepID=UPI00244587BE|nr:uncharacterized protein LOC129583693 isoform X5 [Paramacrobiotus metropolitanus]